MKTIAFLVILSVAGCQVGRRYEDVRFDVVRSREILVGPDASGFLNAITLNASSLRRTKLSGSEPTTRGNSIVFVQLDNERPAIRFNDSASKVFSGYVKPQSDWDSSPAFVSDHQLVFVRGSGAREYSFGGTVPKSYSLMSLTRDKAPRVLAGDFRYLWLWPGCYQRSSVYFIGEQSKDDVATLYTCDLKDGKLRKVFASDSIATVCADPNSDKIAYTESVDREQRLFVRSGAGGRARQLGGTAAYVSQIRFAPNGKSVYVLADSLRDRNMTLYSVSLATGKWEKACQINMK